MKKILFAVLLFSLFIPLFAEEDFSYDSYGFQTNFNLFFSDSYDYSNQKNYMQGKISIDLAEGWFGRLGIYSSIGFDIGGELDKYSTSNKNVLNLISTVYTPEIGVSYYLNPTTIVSGGLGLTQTWYRTTETSEIDGKSKIHTTIYSCGVEIPIKIRYYLNDKLALTGSLVPMLQPGSPSEDINGKTKTRVVFLTQCNLGITFSIPSKRL